MNRLSNIYLSLISGLILGLFISGLISLSLWLDMRVHSYHTVIVITLITVISSRFIEGFHKLFFVIGIVALVYGVVADKFSRYVYDFREVLGAETGINFAIYLLLGLVITGGIIAIIKVVKEIRTR